MKTIILFFGSLLGMSSAAHGQIAVANINAKPVTSVPTKCALSPIQQWYMLTTTTPWTPYYCSGGTSYAFGSTPGGGTVTSAGNVNLTNLFNCTVSNPTTTPTWSCAFVSTPALPNGSTGTTQSANSADTKLATDAYSNTQVASGTATLTNKTFDTAGTGNSLKVNGTALTAVSGTGAVCLASGSACSGGGVAIGSPVTSGTAGSILFVDGSGNLAQDNAVLNWDDLNQALVITSTVTGSSYTGIAFTPIMSTMNVTDTTASGWAGVVGDVESADTNAAGTLSIGGNFSSDLTVTGTSPVQQATVGVKAFGNLIGGNLSGTPGAVGLYAQILNNSGASTISNAVGVLVGSPNNSGTISNYEAIHVRSLGGGIVTAACGLCMDNLGSTNYAIKTGLGAVNLGDVLTLTRGFTVGAGANQLPGSPVVGMVARVTDALAPVIGSAVAGSGAAAALCWWNGSQWTVIGI